MYNIGPKIDEIKNLVKIGYIKIYKNNITLIQNGGFFELTA